jgi:transcriptional regulator with XRE-family HTH domain
VQYKALFVVFTDKFYYFYTINAIYCTMQIEKTIKERREVLRLTQSHLAELAGIGLRTLKNIESGKGNPSIETLNKIADILGMEILLVIKGTVK